MKQATRKLVVRRMLKASRERIFAHLSDPVKMSKWFSTDRLTANVTNDFRVGGKYAIKMSGDENACAPAGEYLEIVPPEKLVFTWSNADHVRNSVVTIELLEKRDQTELVLTHELPPDAIKPHQAGWKVCLGNLDEILKVEKVKPASTKGSATLAKLQTYAGVKQHKVVSQKEWLSARRQLLVKEKKFSKLRDQLAQQRRDLPWVKVDKDYVFEGAHGKQSLADLFCGKSQLIVYHFMFGPGWEEGCAHCSFWADHYDSADLHIGQRDTSLVVISRAPLSEIEPFKKRMGWNFKWFSANQTDFNFDFHVSFTPEQLKTGKFSYNYTNTPMEIEEREGVSAFYKDKKGDIYHTYSAFARGIDLLNTTYNFLDLTAKGRDEGESKQDWVRYHDKYKKVADSSCC